MKKLLALFLLFFILYGCGVTDSENGNEAGYYPTQANENATDDGRQLTFETVRIAFIHVGSSDDRGYTYRQHRGTLDMMSYHNISDRQVLNFFNIVPGHAVDLAVSQSIEWGADLIFGTSFAFEPHMISAAQDNPDVLFFHATGNQALASGLPNMHNYFGNMAQARFLSGIAAGLRTETNTLGFVAAHPFSEVISGFTAFYLGALSVNPDVLMYVIYTNAWNNPTLEMSAAQTLINMGADVIGQHVDSTATQLVAEANGVWGVGYNNDMNFDAPTAVLTSPMFDWSVYLIYAVDSAVNGRSIYPDFLAGMAEGMVFLGPLNPYTIAHGTEEAINEAKALILAGKNIFTGPVYDVNGQRILDYGEEFIEPIAAPSWAYIIQGITVKAD